MLSAPTVYLLFGTLTRTEDKAWLYRRLVPYGSPITDELLGEIADTLVFTWCGVPRWFARNLWSEVLGQWVGFEGQLTGRGVDVAALDPARATRLVWSTLTTWHSHDKDKGQSWRRRIEAEPLPMSARSRRATPSKQEASADADAFMTMFAAVGGRAR